MFHRLIFKFIVIDNKQPDSICSIKLTIMEGKKVKGDQHSWGGTNLLGDFSRGHNGECYDLHTLIIFK